MVIQNRYLRIAVGVGNSHASEGSGGSDGRGSPAHGECVLLLQNGTMREEVVSC